MKKSRNFNLDNLIQEERQKKVNLNKIIQENMNKRQKEIADLETQSKQLYELIKTEKFTVNDVISETYTTSFTPRSESVMGGTSPVYSGGFTTKLILNVTPDNQNIPIRTLNFYGFSIVHAGNYISAQIPVYKEENITNFLYKPHHDRTFYFERNFNPEEFAIELAILSAEGNILRRDRSIQYKKFAKK